MGFLLILLAIMAIGLFWGTCTADGDEKVVGACAGAVFGLVIGAVIVGIVWLGIALPTISNINRMRTFNQYSIQQYDRAIEEIEAGIQVDSNGDYILDAANLSQVKAYSDAITARRGAVNVYNQNLVSQRYWERNWFVGVLFPDAPESLTFIEVG